MTKTFIAVFEIIFNISYLLTIWILVYRMFKSKSKHYENKLFAWAFFLLAFGDTFHVGLRIIAHLFGDINKTIPLFGTTALITGIGAFFTAVTVTLTYMCFNRVWYQKFKNYSMFYYAIILFSVIRLFLILLPQNNWLSETSFVWSLTRNAPLVIIGVLLIFVLYFNGKKEKTPFYTHMAVWILISYLFYIPVILFVRIIPMLGMLMMPKTLAYLVMAFLVYSNLFKEKTT